MVQTDIAIIGGGIVGLSTAYSLAAKYPERSFVVIEKESAVAAHQSGLNSGVIHSGIYYKPGSLKAKFCILGKRLIEEFCEREGVDYKICGKLIVALNESEQRILQGIYENGTSNGVRCSLLSREEMLEIEPHIAGTKGVSVPGAGIVDYRTVCKRLQESLSKAGYDTILSAKVLGFRNDGPSRSVIQTTNGDYSALHIINCAGLYSDRIARMLGEKPNVQIVPFRGEYYKLTSDASHLCNNLIYPVPDPNFPFLGVHFTRRISGQVDCGPNAVLAFSREGYSISQVDLRDLYETIAFPGCRKLAQKHFRMGVGEMWRSVNKRAFLRALQNLMPELKMSDLEVAKSGIRAQAVDINGNLVDDFCIQQSERAIHVYNVPSPAATASFAIGEHIVEQFYKRYES